MNVADAKALQAYNQWANGRILGAVAELAPEQLRRAVATSHGSVWGTLVHIVRAEWRWLGRWQRASSPGPLDPEKCADLPSLRAFWMELEKAQRRFVEQLTDSALEEPLSYENPPGVTWTYPLSDMVRQVVNHSTYHRGQVTTLLRQLGGTPVATDWLVFRDETAPTRS
ncbi:MAG TPA: DinB family protein [Candidatus Krumholzibacteria bacterium]|nr:DinB family protein [Candidatus Krumholzibacteria bacterium]